MRRAVAGIWASPSMEGALALVTAAVFFALGGLLGCLLAFQIESAGADALSGYLAGFLLSAKENTLSTPEFVVILWRHIRWPLAVFALGFTSLGVPGVPLLCGLRSFFLSFSIASFARCYGWKGLELAFYLLGVTSLISVPVFMILAVQSLSAAGALAARSGGSGRRSLPYGRCYFRRCGMCAAAIGICALLERYCVPVWIASVVATLAL